MEWFALFIPLLACGIALRFFKSYFAWWEYPLITLSVTLVILLCKFGVKTSLVKDTEYWGSMVVEARYYEYWESYVHQTCSYTTCDGYDDKGNCTGYTTHYYDCSYCDHNPAYWKAYDDAGNDWRISEEYYNYLKDKWSAKPRFVDMDRSIDNYGSCGQDGNMYSIGWNRLIETSEASVTKHTYTNKVQASHSAFKLAHISTKEAKKLGLYPYPDFYNYYKQKVILGLDSIYTPQEIYRIETRFQYFNGKYGAINKIKLFICLFYDKPMGISYKQEAYWDGGNQNELVICIGLNRATREIQWVRPFSWTDRKRLLVDSREDIASIGKFEPTLVFNAIEQAVAPNGNVYKDFKKDFNYLTVDLPGWSLWLIWILTIAVTGGNWWWCFKNDLTLADPFNQY